MDYEWVPPARGSLNVRPNRTGIVMEERTEDSVHVLQRFWPLDEGTGPRTHDFTVELYGIHENVELELQPTEPSIPEGWEVVLSGEPVDGEFPVRLAFQGEGQPVVDQRGLVTDFDNPVEVSLRFVHDGQEHVRTLYVTLCNNEAWRKVCHLPMFSSAEIVRRAVSK